MVDRCPEGEYWDEQAERCKKSIVVKRKGVYGKGFLSEPQEQQFARIDEVEKEESPAEVHEQLSAMHSFVSHDPKYAQAAERDLKYSETKDPTESGLNQVKGGEKNMSGRCGPGEIWVEGYAKSDGTRVVGYCRRFTAHDERVDERNGKDASGSGWKNRK